MEGKSEISSLMEKLELDEETLVVHRKANDQFSRSGNAKALEAIPEERRERIAKFYSKLRRWGIYNYHPETGRFGRSVGYCELWVQILRNDPRRPEMENVNVDEVRQLIENGLEEVHERMGISGKTRGNMGRAVAKVFRGVKV